MSSSGFLRDGWKGCEILLPIVIRKHDILVLSTANLLASYADVVELSPLNSGAVHPATNYPRGLGTFCQISDYPWAQRCRCAPREPICELTVPYAVLDVSSLLIDVLPAV